MHRPGFVSCFAATAWSSRPAPTTASPRRTHRAGRLRRRLHDRRRHRGDPRLPGLRAADDERDGGQRRPHRSAVDVPVIADADTGYGNELNVTRTVREYERRGVAGIHIEDQVFPKKCGHLDDKEIVPRDDYLAKIRAAVGRAGAIPDFMIIARTDARAVLGFDEAIRRANAALAAGADMAFVEAPQTAGGGRGGAAAGQGPACSTWCGAARRRTSTFAKRRAHGLQARDRARAAAQGCHRRLRRDCWRS